MREFLKEVKTSERSTHHQGTDQKYSNNSVSIHPPGWTGEYLAARSSARRLAGLLAGAKEPLFYFSLTFALAALSPSS